MHSLKWNVYPRHERRSKVKKALLVLILVMVAVSVCGCRSAARSMVRNTQYMIDDTWRFVGLDQPSQLHPRDYVPEDLFEPYTGYR